VATPTLPQEPQTDQIPTRQESVLRHYGALFLIPRNPKVPTGRPDLYAYVFEAGATMAEGLHEAAGHLAENFTYPGPLSITRPCGSHSVLWLVDVRDIQRFGVAQLSAHVLGRLCPACSGAQQLTLLNQGATYGD
jgi:hypothetical protein